MSEHKHTLKQPITLPDGTALSEIVFPPMKGKYMRKFAARANAGGEQEISYDQLMGIGAAMLADRYGAVTAGVIFDEMQPEDVHDVVAWVGEAFAGGQTTGKTA